MSKDGGLYCRKELKGKCEINQHIDPGDSYLTCLVVGNDGSSEITVDVADALPWLAESGVASATETGDSTGASGFAGGALPFAETVVLPPYTEVTYEVEITTSEDACGTSTNVATVCLHEADPANPEAEPAPGKYAKFVASNPVIVGSVSLRFCPDRQGRRHTADKGMFMHYLTSGPEDIAKAQMLMDRIESCRSLIDYLLIVEQLAEAAGLEFPKP